MRLFCCSTSFDVNWTHESKCLLMTLHIDSSEGHYFNVSLPKEIQISQQMQSFPQSLVSSALR